MIPPNKLFFFSLLLFFTFIIINEINVAQAGEKNKIVVGHISTVLSAGIDERDARASLEMLTSKMTQAYPEFHAKNILFPDLETAVDACNKGTIDLLSITSINYLEVRDRFSMVPTYVSSPGSNPGDDYVLLVKKKGGTQNLSQLQGKKIIIRTGYSGTIALMWLNTMLLEQSLPEYESFFQTIKKVDKGSHAVLPVFFNQADACIVHYRTYNTMIELNPQVEKKVTILFQSESYIDTITCIRKGLDKNVEEIILGFGNKVNNDPEGQQMLMIFRMKKIFEYKPEYLVNIEKLYKKYKALKTAVQ